MSDAYNKAAHLASMRGNVSDAYANSPHLLAIAYNVWISGTMLSMEKKQCIKSIEVKETVNGADTATLVIADPQFLFIEDNIFLEDNKIKIILGWDNTTHRVTFDGYISAIDITFGSDGIPVVTATCMDNTHTMNRTKKDATFNNCTSADVVKRLCAEYGFTCIIENNYNFKVQETITQSNQTDIDFITKLAGDEVYPFTARLVGSTFYYVKKGRLETPKMTLVYKKYPHTVVSFTPRINKETKQVEISNSSLTTRDKSVSTTTASSGNTKSGSASASGSSSSESASGGYASAPTEQKAWTYNPVTQTWS